MINEAASQAEPDPDATAGTEAPSAAGPAAALERLFGEYHFPAGPRRILLAAATAFAERGFHATTRDIAAQAGLSSAALYFYFHLAHLQQPGRPRRPVPDRRTHR